MQTTRERCVERDGGCRLRGVTRFGPCFGESQWAHYGDKKRFKTRGMDPEERHTTEGSLMFCRGHHDRYDGRATPRIAVRPLTGRGCDGALEFESGGEIYREVA